MLTLSSLLAVAAGAFVACGGKVADIGNSSADDIDASSTGATEGGVTTGSGSGGGSSGGSGSGGTISSDAGSAPGASEDGGVHPTNGGGTTCGTTTCDAKEDCCGGMDGLTCVTKGTCMGLALTCESAMDCAAPDVCCVSRTGMGGGGGGGGGGGQQASSACAAACGTMGGGGMGGGGAQLCATDAECKNGGTCQAAFGDIKVCSRKGGG